MREKIEKLPVGISVNNKLLRAWNSDCSDEELFRAWKEYGKKHDRKRF